LKLAERTMVVFASDNGGLHVLESKLTPATHNSPFRAGKGFVYEGGLRVPLVIRAPGRVKAETIIEQPVVLTDLMPTFLELAGIDTAKSVGPLDGVSLTKLLGGTAIPARPLFWHFPNYTNQGGRAAGAVREGDWKLVEEYEDGSVELFNLADDPGRTGLTSRKRKQRVRQSLRPSSPRGGRALARRSQHQIRNLTRRSIARFTRIEIPRASRAKALPRNWPRSGKAGARP
jgi:arylsulfatase A-like enzyme